MGQGLWPESCEMQRLQSLVAIRAWDEFVAGGQIVCLRVPGFQKLLTRTCLFAMHGSYPSCLSTVNGHGECIHASSRIRCDYAREPPGALTVFASFNWAFHSRDVT